MTTFTTQVDHNPYLRRGGTDVAAVVSVNATGTQAATSGPSSVAELVIVDVSGSMSDPITKMIAARTATVAAIDCVGDGVPFGVIAGNNQAHEVYPRGGRLAIASETTRKDAADAVRALEPGGGTAIGRWLGLAKELFAGHADASCHAILLTDGINEHESDDDFTAAIAACEGVFVCDCRGVGEGWSVPELRRVASALLGTVEYIRDPADMAADFASTMRASLSKGAGDVQLRVWTPKGATVRSVQQVYPSIEDLTERRREVDERTGDYPTPPWGDEDREYQVSVTVPAREVDEQALAARVSLVVDGEVLSQAKVEVTWTDEEQLHTRINATVEQAEQQIALTNAINDGMAALEDGDVEHATARLGRARELAAMTGDAEKLAMLDRIVDHDDTTGQVAIKPDALPEDLIEIHTRSVKTGKTRSPGGPAAGSLP